VTAMTEGVRRAEPGELCTCGRPAMPPLAVGMKKGLSSKVLIAALLMLLGHIPGVIYALYVITND